ncbi:MAG: GTP-binding protein [Candidatus Helarchaeota archaeon]|nr:GTP-binding protein [Candidatus Helarchaeota archaeon]
MVKKDFILKGVVYNAMGDVGPEVKFHHPKSDFFDDATLTTIAIKSITLLTGDEGHVPDQISIILYAKYQLLGILFQFEVTDEKSRGGVVDSNIIILFNEKYSSIAYKYSDLFNALLIEVAKKINESEMAKNREEVESIIVKLYETLIKNLDSLKKAEAQALKTVKKKKPAYRFKIVVIGDGRVGKTTTLLRYVDNAFQETYLPTIGVNVSNKDISLARATKKVRVRLNFYDIAGQEKFKLMRRVFYEGLNGAVIMFDITSIESFQHLDNWIKDVSEAFSPKKVKGIIVGNKIDLESQRIIKKEDAEAIAKKFGLDYIEVSAKSGEKINEAFTLLAKIVMKK